MFIHFLCLCPLSLAIKLNFNISKVAYCWAQHVARVWPPCCDMLGVVGSNLRMVKFEQTTPNMSQHIATRWPNARNMLRQTMLRYVASACCDRLAGAFKRSQHANACNATYRNIVGRNMLRAFGHHVAACWVLLAQI